ncbi:MAG: acyl-CoA dehydrogenase family protein [Desulfobacterales bacterium]|nr:acyl-CoA dehydrogenase family protein [Desulfobacterales bacterium]
MYCGFTEEQEMWRKTVNDFMDKEVGREYCRKVYQERQYPYEFYDKVVKQGWLGLMIPEKYGGVESDVVMYTIMNEALAKFGVDIATSVSVSAFSAMNIVHHGTEEQKDRYLSRVVKGEIRFSISITEPNAGSDAASLATSARLDGDHFIVNGQKVFASAAHAKNNIMCMGVRTDTSLPKHKGISVLLVPNDLPGLEMRRLDTLARRATGTNEVFLDNVMVPKENLLGELNGGWKILTGHLEIERAAVAGMNVGNAQTAVDDAIRYAKEREQFGRPIGQFQVIKHMLAQMQLEVDAARLLTYRAAAMTDMGIPCRKEVSMAKLFASETLFKVATQGMQIMGGYGTMPEYDMERYFREGKQATIGGGTSEIQRGIIARELGL